jgi:competence ComEA-like helix-hairpin-helix protein
VGLFAALAGGQELPQGKGKDLVEQVCVGCHGLEVIAGQHATSKGWSGIVDNMIERGATATPEEFRTIVEYLAKNFAKAATVNVNRADAKEIETSLDLTGKEAQAIVKYRQDHGGFKDWESLLKVTGVDAKKLEVKKERVSF